MRNVLAFLFSLLIIQSSCGQVNQAPAGQMGNFPARHVEKGIDWSSTVKDLGKGYYEIKLVGDIKAGWHTYSKDLAKDVTPLPGSITFEPSKDYQLEGTYKESGTRVEVDDPVLKEHYIEFTGKLTLTQKIKVTSLAADVKGGADYQICNDKNCLPPDTYKFEFKLSPVEVKGDNYNSAPASQAFINALRNVDTVKKRVADTAAIASAAAATKSAASSAAAVSSMAAKTAEDTKNETATDPLWKIFLLGLGYGLLALIQPCVFPIIPLTVSFFTKRSENKNRGRINALIYAASILVIFVAIGFLISLIFGANALNKWSSSWAFNLLFFGLLILFSLSFFGVFEITLPSSWINKSENVADKGGVLGIFFMAFSLVLVSFSCTVPIIGNLLPLITQGDIVRPLVGMSAFGLALAVPFGFFAFFPALLQSLPKSGGWMNTVKITMGFVELALSLIYLSKVDLTYHWHILDRDIYLCLWIVIFALLGYYLIGRFRFAHDSEVHYISVPRLFFAIASFSFAVYMVPGLWGAPLKGISGFIPPLYTQDFDLTRLSATSQSANDSVPAVKKYSGFLETPLGIDGYYDYDEGTKAARFLKKPVLLDFTGHTCLNCRKMEAVVWSDPAVLKNIKDNFVVISLYTDDKEDLPEKEQYMSKNGGGKITTLGDKCTDLELTLNNSTTQPFYILVDNKGKFLNSPRSTDYDVAAYASWLDEGLAEYKKRNTAK